MSSSLKGAFKSYARETLMTTVEVLQLCEARKLALSARGDVLDVEGDEGAIDELGPHVAEHVTELLALLAREPGASAPPNCRSCARPVDEKRRCWHCGKRPCETCGRDSGSVLLAYCLPCDLGNRG